LDRGGFRSLSANSPDWVLVEFGAALAGIVLITLPVDTG
jgi:hypothetical protein